MSRYSQYTRTYKTILFQALVITVLFHLALLYSFIYRPGRKTVSAPQRRHITLLNLDRSSATVNSEMLRRWLIYHNPNLFARPDYRYGYGAISQDVPIRPPVADIVLPKPLGEILPLPEKFNFLKADKRLKFDNNSRWVDYATLGVRTLPLPKFQHHSYPLVKLSDGRYLDGILSNEELQYRNLTLNGKEGVTRLRITLPENPAMLPRIMLRQSSGNRKLDRLAIQKLLLNQSRLYPLPVPQEKHLAADIIWHEVKQ